MLVVIVDFENFEVLLVVIEGNMVIGMFDIMVVISFDWVCDNYFVGLFIKYVDSCYLDIDNVV